MNQDQIIKKVFESSSRNAKTMLGGSFHDLHTLAKIKINQQQKEIEELKQSCKEMSEEIAAEHGLGGLDYDND